MSHSNWKLQKDMGSTVKSTVLPIRNQAQLEQFKRDILECHRPDGQLIAQRELVSKYLSISHLNIEYFQFPPNHHNGPFRFATIFNGGWELVHQFTLFLGFIKSSKYGGYKIWRKNWKIIGKSWLKKFNDYTGTLNMGTKILTAWVNAMH